jgi:hypothetical protein
MVFKFWRTVYHVFGWEYPEKADERQKHLKHCLCKQIKETEDIQKILKEQGEIKEKDFVHIDLCKQHSKGHYTNAFSSPCLDIPVGYMRPDTPIPYVKELQTIHENSNKHNNKSKSKTRKRKKH